MRSGRCAAARSPASAGGRGRATRAACRTSAGTRGRRDAVAAASRTRRSGRSTRSRRSPSLRSTPVRMRSPGSVSGVNSSGASAQTSGPEPRGPSDPPPPQPARSSSSSPRPPASLRLLRPDEPVAPRRVGVRRRDPTWRTSPATTSSPGCPATACEPGHGGSPPIAGAMSGMPAPPARSTSAPRRRDHLLSPAVAPALAVPPEVVAVGVARAVGPHSHLVARQTLSNEVSMPLAGRSRRGSSPAPEQLHAVAPVVVDVVVLTMSPFPPKIPIPVPTGAWNVGQTIFGSRSRIGCLQYASRSSLKRSRLFE